MTADATGRCKHCAHKAGSHTPQGGCMNPGLLCGCTWSGDELVWATGFTPNDRDIAERKKLRHPESGALEPGESWGGLW
jgi:hypothetical protein